MAMSDMGPDCPMAGTNNLASTDCPQNCCTQAFAQALTPLAAPDKLRLAALTSFAAIPPATFQPKSSIAAEAPVESNTASPPRYLLIQVFRI